MAQRPNKPDKFVQRILEVLRSTYGSKHAKAIIHVYRYNSASIRIRIIDPDLTGKDLVEREETVWPILQALPGEILSEITVLLLITPKERKSSFMSMDFDDRTASPL
jgi:hypothetical protein